MNRPKLPSRFAQTERRLHEELLGLAILFARVVPVDVFVGSVGPFLKPKIEYTEHGVGSDIFDWNREYIERKFTCVDCQGECFNVYQRCFPDSVSIVYHVVADLRDYAHGLFYSEIHESWGLIKRIKNYVRGIDIETPAEWRDDELSYVTTRDEGPGYLTYERVWSRETGIGVDKTRYTDRAIYEDTFPDFPRQVQEEAEEKLRRCLELEPGPLYPRVSKRKREG